MNYQWEQFLDDVVSHIRDKKIKDETREELLDHLEDRKERFMRFGDSEEKAERKSLENMGDCDTISNQLGKLHSFSYIDQLSRAMLITFFGFLFSLFNINIGNISILNPIGAALIFAGTYMLRGCNANLKKAYRITLLKIVWTAFAYSIKGVTFFAKPQSEWISYSVLITGIVISIIHFAFLLTGLGKLCNDAAKDANFTAPKMTRSVIAYITANTATLLGAVSKNSNWVIPALAVVTLCFAYILISVFRAYIIIHKTEYRTEKIDKFGKKGVGTLAAALVFVILSVEITCYFASTPKIQAKVYTPVHTEEADKIRAELIQNGFPEDIADLLPDEEIEKCYPLDESMDILLSRSISSNNSSIPGIIAVPTIDSETGEKAARYIYTFGYKDGAKIYGYRDSVAAYFPFTPDFESDGYGLFYKKDNVIYKQNPLLFHRDNNNIINGLEYRTVKDADRIFGYIAVTGEPIQPNQRSKMIVYISEKYPCNYPHYNAFDVTRYDTGAISYNPLPLSKLALNGFTMDTLSYLNYFD